MRELDFEHAGARLFAYEEGVGQPLVLLHGALADHRASLTRAGALTSRFRVLAPDLRGSGRSHSTHALSWDLFADDLAALFDSQGLGRAIIVGFSTGSGVAIRFAQRHPERVSKLVVVSPLYEGADRGLTSAQLSAFKSMDDASQRALTSGVDALLPLYETLPPEQRARAFTMAAGFDPESLAVTTRFFASGVQPFADPSGLQEIAAPALIIPGDDALHPAEVAELYAANLVSSTLDPRPDLADAIDDFCATSAAG